MSLSHATLYMALRSLSICSTSLNTTDKKILSLFQVRIVVSKGIAFAYNKYILQKTLYIANRLYDAVEYLLMMASISRVFCEK